MRSQVDKQHAALVPVDERQFAFDAPVARVGDGGDRERAVVERVTVCPTETLSIDGSAAGVARRRDRVLGLGVRQPPALAVRKDQMPLVPAAVVVFVDDAADDGEGPSFQAAFGANLNRRAVGRQVADFAERFEVDVVAHDHGLAVGTDRLDRTRPPELDRRAAVRAGSGPKPS